jgi:7 transmembrane receptor (rhodopsin family)
MHDNRPLVGTDRFKRAALTVMSLQREEECQRVFGRTPDDESTEISVLGGIPTRIPHPRLALKPTAVAAAAVSALMIAYRKVNQTRIHEQREMRATIRMAIIIAFFCCMWLGFFVQYVVSSLRPQIPDDVCSHASTHLEVFLFWLGYSNSSVNPILYTIFNEDFRRAFQKILGCGKRQGRGSGSTGDNRSRASFAQTFFN